MSAARDATTKTPKKIVFNSNLKVSYDHEFGVKLLKALVEDPCEGKENLNSKTFKRAATRLKQDTIELQVQQIFT